MFLKVTTYDKNIIFQSIIIITLKIFVTTQIKMHTVEQKFNKKVQWNQLSYNFPLSLL